MKDLVKELKEENERLRKANLYLIDINNQLDDTRSLQNDIIDRCKEILDNCVFLFGSEEIEIHEENKSQCIIDAKDASEWIENSQDKLK